MVSTQYLTVIRDFRWDALSSLLFLRSSILVFHIRNWCKRRKWFRNFYEELYFCSYIPIRLWLEYQVITLSNVYSSLNALYILATRLYVAFINNRIIFHPIGSTLSASSNIRSSFCMFRSLFRRYCGSIMFQIRSSYQSFTSLIGPQLSGSCR